MDALAEALAKIATRTVTPRPDCLLWTGATDRGYGRVWLDGTAARVHRVAWEAVNGPVPDDMELDHVCRVRMCCNVDHLELVTHAENVRRALPYRPLATHCRNGHEYVDGSYKTRGGKRQCIACRRASRDARNARRRKAAAEDPAALDGSGKTDSAAA